MMHATTPEIPTAATPAHPVAGFADWYQTHHPGLTEAVLRSVRPEVLAADAIDEAFARAFAAWEQVRTMRSPSGWVYRVAINEARRQLRRAGREGDVMAAAWPASTAPPPGGEAWLEVDHLPTRQRAAVVLRHVAGLTETEVGAALGVTRSTVSSSLAAAYRTLATKLAEDEPRSRPLSDPRSTTSDQPLHLALAQACGPDGCDLSPLSAGAPPSAAYSAAVRDTIKIRPGDLVAIAGTEIVWRWWGGLIEAVGEDGTFVTVSRNVTQSAPGDTRRADRDVDLPVDLAGQVAIGETVWFGSENGRTVVVAVAGPEVEQRAAARFPAIRAASAS